MSERTPAEPQGSDADERALDRAPLGPVQGHERPPETEPLEPSGADADADADAMERLSRRLADDVE